MSDRLRSVVIATLVLAALKLCRLRIEAASMRVKRFGLWLPDGLHIWLGSHGVHLFWAYSPHKPRIEFDREEART